MTKRDALILALKILGVWLILQFIMVAPYPIRFLREGGLTVLLSFFPWAAMAVLGYVLVRHSEWVADKVCRAQEMSPELSLGLNKDDIEEVAFAIVGVCVVALCLPQIGMLVVFVASYWNASPGSGVALTPWQREEAYSRLVRIVLQLAIGLYFILGARGLVNLVKKARTFLVRQPSPQV